MELGGRRLEHGAEHNGAPCGEGDTGEHPGDNDPCESVHGQVIGHISPSPQRSGRVSEVDELRARLAALPTGNEWARR